MSGTDWMGFGQDFAPRGRIVGRSSPASAHTFSWRVVCCGEQAMNYRRAMYYVARHSYYE